MKSLPALFLLVMVAACSQQNVDTKAEGEKLMQLSKEWSRIASTDSIERTLSYWADDAVVMSPGQAPIKGKDSIRAMIDAASKIPGFKISWEPLSVFVSKSGDFAYMIEQNVITINDSLGNPITEYNKGVTVWRKDADGSWKNVVDIWNAYPLRKK